MTGQNNSKVNLDNLPRTVELTRDGDGRAVFSFVDQTRLPDDLVRVETGDWRRVVQGIKSLEVRGAPAIGIAGAAALALWAINRETSDGDTSMGSSYGEYLSAVADEIVRARPTAVNLSWAVGCTSGVARRMMAEGSDAPVVARALFTHVKSMEREDEEVNRRLGAAGEPLVPERARVLTHCNAGSLATAFFGTALGIVYTAAEKGKIARVYADETRPVNQGARLTSWELSRAGIPVTVICDDMAASLMARGEVDVILVGADRVCANGDVANKIGTYGLAVLAHYHDIPLYVAAPSSTIDMSLERGEQIPIEERDPTEIMSDPPAGVALWNPAFDVTPAALVTGIVTDRGVFAPNELRMRLSDGRA